MPISCSAGPLSPSPEKRSFNFPPPLMQEEEDKTILDQQDVDSPHNEDDYIETEALEYSRNMNNMMSGGSDEFDQVVFEDNDDDSEEAVSFRRQIQEQRLKQQRPDYLLEDEEESMSSDRVSSMSSAVELITVERWTVDNRDRNHQPASLTITSGVQIQGEREEHTRPTEKVAASAGGSQAVPSTESSQGVSSTASSTGSSEFETFGYIDVAKTNQAPTTTVPVEKDPWTKDKNNEGIQSGCQLVREIYDQITLHDAPAVNECSVIQEQLSLVDEDKELMVTPKAYTKFDTPKVRSSQRHDATTGRCPSFDTEDTASNQDIVEGNSHSQEQIMHSFFRHLQKQPESKMGHMALGTLCSWTLDTLQAKVPISSFDTVNTNTPKTTPSKPPSNSNHDNPLATKTLTESESVTTKKPNNPGTPQSAAKSSKWKKLKAPWKKKKKSSTGHFAEVSVDKAEHSVEGDIKQHQEATAPALTVSIPPAFSDEENTVEADDRFDRSTQLQQNDSGTRYPATALVQSPKGSFPMASPRLQMFGSEYARFLSTSILAPKIRSPRFPQTSASSRYGPFSTRRRGAGTSSGSGGTHQIMSYSSFGSVRSKGKSSTASWNLEDQDNAVLTGAIVDICITNGSDTPPPKGYYRISQTVDGEEFRALRAGGAVSPRRKSSSTYINVKKESNWQRAAQRPCVTALTIIFPDRQEFVPPGFCVVREHRRCPSQSQNHPKGTGGSSATRKQESDTTIKDQPANFNTHFSNGERVFLCFRRSREGNPITGILPLQPAFSEAIPDGYTVLERSPRNFVASLNPKHGSPVFLAFRQRLANLEPLRPLPLLLSVQSPNGEHQALGRSLRAKEKKPKLSAYYCTGGTVVESEVGRYHIMDRSTHDLLSPSSVSNRLSLIELSRRKSMPQLAGEYDNPTNSRSEAHVPDDTDVGQSSHSSVGSFPDGSNPSLSFGTSNSMAEYPRNSNASFSSRDSNSFDHTATPSFVNEDDTDVPSVILSSFPSSQNQAEGYYQKRYDHELQINHDAFNFIPVVKTATHPSQMEPQRRLRARTAILTPILTACYQRHGGAALKAIEGLTNILTETDFFADDVDWSGSEATTRLTLLDLTVQVACDIATGGAQETTFGACVEFVENAVRYSKGHFNTRTVGYVLRFYLFVFYFGASVPANKIFPNANLESSRIGLAQPDTAQILFDPRVGSNSSYLPGGAPQLAALSFKELIALTVARLQRVCLATTHARVCANGEGIEMGGILSSLIDGAVNRVDVANFTQMAIHQMHRSGGSELFWHDMTTSCGVGLFGKESDLHPEVRNMFVMTFAVLANLVKVASGKIRTNAETFELRPRDVSSKLLSLELLFHFLQQYRDEQKDWMRLDDPRKETLARCVDTMVFAVRRLVVPCILANTRAGLEDPCVFQRIMRIVSLLWRTPMYRDRMKGEMGMLIEHFALRMLQLGPQLQQSRLVHSKSPDVDKLACPLLRQQLVLLKEMKRWFSADPKATIEMYLNFDTDITSQVSGPMPLLPGTQWKVFQRICATLCNLAEQCGDLIGEQIRESQTTSSSTKTTKTKILSFTDGASEAQSDNKEAKQEEMTSIREGARLLRKAALDAIVQILKCLAQTSAVATGQHCYTLVSSWSDPNDTDGFKDENVTGAPAKEIDADEDSECDNESREGGPGSVLNFWRNEMASHRKDEPLAYTFENQTGLLSSVTRDTAFEIARKKSIKKAVEYLIACNALTRSPRDIASFLRVHKDKLDQGALGFYLGEGGIDGQEIEYWNLIRFSYVRAISFDGMKAEEALRHFLTNCGFQLPGEAQKIDRIMSTFAQCYWEDNAGDVKNCPFQDQDTVYLLSFAIIMLNTDLHKSGAPSSSSRGNSKSSRKRITKQEFLKNLAGVEGFEELKRDYLSTIYDSIDANPIILVQDEGMEAQNLSSTAETRERMLKSMLCNVRSTDALLRGLSVHDVKWASLQDFSSSLEYEGAEALSDLTQSCISEAWHQFHGVVNTALESAHLDPEGMEPCVDLLKYALVVTICLDLPMERAAFLSQLGRFKVFEGTHMSHLGSHWVPDEEQGRQLVLKGNPAFDRAIAGPLDDESKLKALVQVHEATQDLRSALKVDIQVKQEMTRVTHQILDGEFLLNDPGRSFVRMDDLKKKSNRSGRFTEYRFFLFSDALIYAKRVSSSHSTNANHNEYHDDPASFAENMTEDENDYKIHEELPLHLMKVVDWFPPSSSNNKQDMMKKAFQVHHPRKTFMVFCSTREERVAWVSDIRAAIHREIQHKVKMEAARMAAAAMSAGPMASTSLPAAATGALQRPV